jgi:hypothetical protein
VVGIAMIADGQEAAKMLVHLSPAQKMLLNAEANVARAAVEMLQCFHLQCKP